MHVMKRQPIQTQQPVDYFKPAIIMLVAALLAFIACRDMIGHSERERAPISTGPSAEGLPVPAPTDSFRPGETHTFSSTPGNGGTDTVDDVAPMR